MTKKSTVVVGVVAIVAASILLAWALVQGVLVNKLSGTNSQEPVLPPLYLSQMGACSAAGGKVEKETKNMGSYQAISRWKCVCKGGESFFGENFLPTKLTCDQWLTPATR